MLLSCKQPTFNESAWFSPWGCVNPMSGTESGEKNAPNKYKQAAPRLLRRDSLF